MKNSNFTGSFYDCFETQEKKMHQEADKGREYLGIATGHPEFYPLRGNGSSGSGALTDSYKRWKEGVSDDSDSDDSSSESGGETDRYKEAAAINAGEIVAQTQKRAAEARVALETRKKLEADMQKAAEKEALERGYQTDKLKVAIEERAAIKHSDYYTGDHTRW